MQTYSDFRKHAAASWQDMMNMEPADAYNTWKDNVSALEERLANGEFKENPTGYITEYAKLHEDIAGPNNDFQGSPGYDWGLHILNGIEDPDEREQWLSNLEGWNILTDENREQFLNSSKWGYRPPDPIPPGPVVGGVDNNGPTKTMAYTNIPENNVEQMRADAKANAEHPVTSNGKRYGRNLVGSPYVTKPGYKPGNRERIEAPSTPKVDKDAPMRTTDFDQPTQADVEPKPPMKKLQSYAEFRKRAEEDPIGGAGDYFAETERKRKEDEAAQTPWYTKAWDATSNWMKENPHLTAGAGALLTAGAIYPVARGWGRDRNRALGILAALAGGGLAYWGINKWLTPYKAATNTTPAPATTAPAQTQAPAKTTA